MKIPWYTIHTYRVVQIFEESLLLLVQIVFCQYVILILFERRLSEGNHPFSTHGPWNFYTAPLHNGYGISPLLHLVHEILQFHLFNLVFRTSIPPFYTWATGSLTTPSKTWALESTPTSPTWILGTLPTFLHTHWPLNISPPHPLSMGPAIS